MADQQHSIYVAGQWADPVAHQVVTRLRRRGHVVYSGDELDGSWQWMSPGGVDVLDDVGPSEFVPRLRDRDLVRRGELELRALEDSDVLIVVVPASRPADTLLGYALARGLRCVVLQSRPSAPELMYGLAERITADVDELEAIVEDMLATAQPVYLRGRRELR